MLLLLLAFRLLAAAAAASSLGLVVRRHAAVGCYLRLLLLKLRSAVAAVVAPVNLVALGVKFVLALGRRVAIPPDLMRASLAYWLPLIDLKTWACGT